MDWSLSIPFDNITTFAHIRWLPNRNAGSDDDLSCHIPVLNSSQLIYLSTYTNIYMYMYVYT